VSQPAKPEALATLARDLRFQGRYGMEDQDQMARRKVLERQRAAELIEQQIMPRPLADWNEDDGHVTWWAFPVEEPAWIGTPLCEDWPGYHTHWTPHPVLPIPPELPAAAPHQPR
jgi:hypothetical protein